MSSEKGSRYAESSGRSEPTGVGMPFGGGAGGIPASQWLAQREEARQLDAIALGRGGAPVTLETDKYGRQNVSSGAKWEPIVGYSRAVRVGNVVHVAGTTSLDGEGKLMHAGDAYSQTIRCLEIIQEALWEVGLPMKDVVRTRLFVTDITQWEAIGSAHGEFFKHVRPACTMVQVSRLIDPNMMVEIEAIAIKPQPTKTPLHEPDPDISCDCTAHHDWRHVLKLRASTTGVTVGEENKATHSSTSSSNNNNKAKAIAQLSAYARADHERNCRYLPADHHQHTDECRQRKDADARHNRRTMILAATTSAFVASAIGTAVWFLSSRSPSSSSLSRK